MDLTFWVWVTIAMILLAGEVLSSGMLMLPFGVGAASAAIASAMHLGSGAQWIAFLVVSSVLMVVLQRRLARRNRR
jgi:membrane protein implicated in regulation of membrane protease activity